jgi:hypothetical protein
VAAGGQDIRFDPRLRAALEEAGALGTVGTESVPTPIRQQFVGWVDDGWGNKASVVWFPETFVVGGQACIQVRLAGGSGAGFRDLAVGVQLRSDGAARDLVVPYCSFRDEGPWMTAACYTPLPTDIVAGAAQLLVTVTGRQSSGDTAGDEGPVSSWQLGPEAVEVLGAAR